MQSTEWTDSVLFPEKELEPVDRVLGHILLKWQIFMLQFEIIISQMTSVKNVVTQSPVYHERLVWVVSGLSNLDFFFVCVYV